MFSIPLVLVIIAFVTTVVPRIPVIVPLIMIEAAVAVMVLGR